MLSQKYISCLTDEGYTLEDATSIIENSIKFIKELKQTNNNKLNKKNINTDLFEDIPGIIENLDPEESLDALILANLPRDDLIITAQSKSILRYYSFWTEYTTDTTLNKVIKLLINSTNEVISFNFALYANNLLTDDLIEEKNKKDILNSIKIFEHYTPLLATRGLKIKNQELLKNLKEIIEADKITTSKHIHTTKYSEGNHQYCLPGRKGHYNSLIAPLMIKITKEEQTHELFDSKFSKNEGKLTLIYLQKQLIGSIKIRKNPNLLGLRTIQNPQGNFPLITGGVYGIHHELAKQAEEAYNQQGKWAKLNLDQIQLYPIRHLAQTEFKLKETKFKQYINEIKRVREKLE